MGTIHIQVFFTIGSTSHDFVKHKQYQRKESQHTVSNDTVIKPLSTDPRNRDFLAFQVVDATQKEKGRYRAKDIVQMRLFMASLGGTGLGLFSQKAMEDTAPIETIQGLWDVVHPFEGGLVQQNGNQDPGSQLESQAVSKLPTSVESVGDLPFYTPNDLSNVGKSHMTFPGTTLPKFSPQATYPKSYRRPQHDTFRPPYGIPVLTPYSIGYGAEVGLPPNVQMLWIPTKETSIFIDHARHITFHKDPRPPKQEPPAPVKKEFKLGDKKVEPDLPSIIHASEVVRYAANRAHSEYKPHGYILKARGVNGNPGAHGRAGYEGYHGNDGRSGHSYGQSGSEGGDGSDGGPGELGTDGNHATAGSDVTISLEGNASELRVSSSYFTFVAKLGGRERPEVLSVNCRGGDGGEGGYGGPGGDGGRGGNGGDGHEGRAGHGSSHGRGGDGGPGGNGGNGGCGGDGGPGGQGGNGGNAGKGGSCVIKAKDARLLMLVEADCMNGNIGQGGQGGKGGLGGQGGRGGIGGQGGYGGKGTWTETKGNKLVHYTAYGAPGRNGTHGNDGVDGGNGGEGAQGRDGKLAKNGGILWVVETEDGRPFQQSGVRYEVEVTHFKVVSGIDDGIFEPNERIAVSGVTVINSGLKYNQKSRVQNEQTSTVKPEYMQSLPLPAGAEIFFPSTNTIQFEPTRYALPALEPDQELVVPITFYGRIFDAPSPNTPGPFLQQANFESHAELLGRCFLKSFRSQKLDVQYPVKIASLQCDENVGRGEVAILEINVRNISQMPYGSCANSGGEVMLQLHLDARLTPVAFGDPNKEVPYTVTYDQSTPDSLYIQMQEIPPDTTIKVEVAIQMDSHAELFQICHWQADLYLRGKMIEYNSTKIRVSPFYIVKDPPADVLLVTDANVTRKEFVFWQHILEVLDVTVDFWDTGRYNGLSVDKQTNVRHPVSWEGRYTGRLILYPHCDLQQLWGIDIARHFHGPNYRDGIPGDLQSSMILFMPPTAPCSVQDEQGKRKADIAVTRHLAHVDESLDLPSYSGMHFGLPALNAAIKREKKILKQLEKTDMSRLVVVTSRQLEIQSSGCFKYTYGVVDIRRCPLLRSCKLVVLDSSGGSIGDIGCDDMHASPMSLEIPLASHYGQTLLATLFGIPLACKLRLIKTTQEESNRYQTPAVDPTFYLPNGYTMKKAQLAAICLATEIAEEVLSCQGITARMNAFTKDVTENPSEYTTNGATVVKTLQLIKSELQQIKKRVSHRNVTNATGEIKRQCNRIQEALCQAGVDSYKQEPLPSMSILHEDGRFYRTHQYFVKDKLWDTTQYARYVQPITKFGVCFCLCELQISALF